MRSQLVERRAVIYRDAVRTEHIKNSSLEDVRERQDGEAAVGFSDRQGFRYGDDVRNKIIVRQHYALRLAGRPRGVDYRCQIVRRDLCQLVFEDRHVRFGKRLALFLERIEADRATFVLGDGFVIEKDKLLETLNAPDRILGMFEKFLPRYAQHLRTGVLQNESDLLDGLGRVDGNVDGPERENREIDERPLRTVFGDDRDAIAGLHTELG